MRRGLVWHTMRNGGRKDFLRLCEESLHQSNAEKAGKPRLSRISALFCTHKMARENRGMHQQHSAERGHRGSGLQYGFRVKSFLLGKHGSFASVGIAAFRMERTGSRDRVFPWQDAPFCGRRGDSFLKPPAAPAEILRRKAIVSGIKRGAVRAGQGQPVSCGQKGKCAFTG